jgi:hypothetical protein
MLGTDPFMLGTDPFIRPLYDPFIARNRPLYFTLYDPFTLYFTFTGVSAHKTAKSVNSGD